MIPVDFRGAALPRSPTIYAEIAERLTCERAAVKAVVAVEAAGQGFLQDGRPKILFEGHVFHRLTGGRFDALAPDISRTRPGGYKGGAKEYPRLGLARSLDADAALRSASWGLAQIMGFNSGLVGFTSVEAFVTAMCEGEDEHLHAFAGFVEAAHLVRPLRDKDWPAFARGYNGAGFAKLGYHTKLAAAYARAKAEEAR